MMKGSELIKKSMYLNLQDNWGDPDKMDPKLIIELDLYCHKLGYQIEISPSNEEHNKESWHYIIPGRNNFCEAIDIYPLCSIIFAWITAMRFSFTGIGLYPYRTFQDLDRTIYHGMLHLDKRFPCVQRVLWWESLDGKYHYLHTQNDVNLLFSELFSGLSKSKSEKA